MGLHESVLLEEAVEWLAPGSGKIFVDGTLGRAGHAVRILERSAPDGKLVGFDKDLQALEESRKVLGKFGDRAVILHDDFKNIAGHLEALGHGKVHGVLLDLGLSSPQLDEASRGFSFKADGPLDMRMDVSEALTAEQIVNQYPQKEIEDILRNFGEERFAGRIARHIVETRSKHRIRTTGELEALIFHAVPSSFRHGRIHPATRSFQALRIVVNHELESLQEFLSHATQMLEEGGRLVIISFHSLEDRIVKNAFREFDKQGLGNILTKKPLQSGEEETSKNPRSRSAKMRVFEKLEEVER